MPNVHSTGPHILQHIHIYILSQPTLCTSCTRMLMCSKNRHSLFLRLWLSTMFLEKTALGMTKTSRSKLRKLVRYLQRNGAWVHGVHEVLNAIGGAERPYIYDFCTGQKQASDNKQHSRIMHEATLSMMRQATVSCQTKLKSALTHQPMSITNPSTVLLL